MLSSVESPLGPEAKPVENHWATPRIAFQIKAQNKCYSISNAD